MLTPDRPLWNETYVCRKILLPLQSILRLLAGDQRGFDKLIGSLRVSEELQQAGIDLAEAEPKPDVSRP